MSDLTPLRKLEDAVHEFVAAIHGDHGALTGWVLSWQESTITDKPDLIPLSFASDFTMGAGTSPELALGLSALTIKRIGQAETADQDDD